MNPCSSSSLVKRDSTAGSLTRLLLWSLSFTLRFSFRMLLPILDEFIEVLVELLRIFPVHEVTCIVLDNHPDFRIFCGKDIEQGQFSLQLGRWIVHSPVEHVVLRCVQQDRHL